MGQQELQILISVGVGAGLFGGLVLLLMMAVKSFLYISRPNEALIFSGGQNTLLDGSLRGYRVVLAGHRAWRKPFVEEVARLDMRTIPIELNVHQAYSSDGIPLSVKAIANVKIASEEKIIGNAIERFLGRGRSEIERVARETLEGTLRGVLATLTPEQVNEDRLRFAESLSTEVADDFLKLGLHLDTLKIQHVSDDKKYLESLGRKQIAEVIKRAEMAESDAENESKKRAEERQSDGAVARQNAERVIVQRRNFKREREAQLKQEVEASKHRAKSAGEQARFEAEEELQTIRKQLEQLRLRADIEIPAEAERRARELVAKGEASPIVENGKALAKALELLAQAWAEAGPHARDIYLIQQVEKLMATVVGKLSELEVGEVHVIDPGDGSALPNYVAGFPATVTRIFEALRRSTGIDVPGILDPNARKGGVR